ncbi:nSTAND1 domain-containing NTPase [Streptomyces sp. NPDC001415]
MSDRAEFQAQARDQARIFQAQRDLIIAERDLHIHYVSGVQQVRRIHRESLLGECPYPGLVEFSTEQSQWFFGRDELTAEIMVRLTARLQRGGPLALIGPTGAGKSSLFRAGLVPAIQRGALGIPGSAAWPCLLFTPTAEPVKSLTSEVAGTVGVRMWAGNVPQYITMIRGALSEQVAHESTAERRLLLVIDRFEELFTQCADHQQRRDFVALISALTKPDRDGAAPVALIAYGLRSDFYDKCAEYAELRKSLQSDQVLIGPLSEEGLRDVIRLPAQDVGLDIEPGLTELLLRDFKANLSTRTFSGAVAGASGWFEASHLPLLSHVLRATWQQKRGNLLTVEGYQATGGISHAVVTTAENAFNKLDPQGRKAAQSLLLRLVRVGDGVANTRQRVPRTDLLNTCGDPAVVTGVIESLTKDRLLVQEWDTVEIIHETLLHAWPRLRRWVEEDRANTLVRQRLEEAATNWSRNHRDSSMLFRGSQLEDACRLGSGVTNKSLPGSCVREFLAASRRQQQRETLIRRTALIFLILATLFSSGAAVFAFQKSDDAETERNKVIVKQIAEEANALRNDDPHLASQLDLIAYGMRPTPSLYTRLLADAQVALPVPNGFANSLAFSPDGRTLASNGNGSGGSSENRALQLWKMTDQFHPTLLGTVTVPLSTDTSLAFKDSRTLAVGGTSNGRATVRLCDLTDPSHPALLEPALTGAGNLISSIAFSRDGRTLAAGDGVNVRLWDTTDRAHPVALGKTPAGHTNTISSVAFSPDGRTLASGGGDEQVRLWDVTDRMHPMPLGEPLRGSTNTVESVVFSPDGRTLASGSLDKQIRLWDVTERAEPKPLGQPLVGHTSFIKTIAYSPDGSTLASGSFDEHIRLWDVRDRVSPKPLGEPLVGHTEFVVSVAFAPDGLTLASSGMDRKIRLWPMKADRAIRRICETTASALTPAKWKQHIPVLAFKPPCG